MFNSHESNQTVFDHQLKHKKLVFEVSITGNATPASKSHKTDLPGVAILRTEGKVAEADAVESVTFTTADDDNSGDSVFGLLLKGSELGSIAKVLKISVSESSTALATALAVTKHGTGGLTSGGNIAFSIAGTGLNLASESPKICVEIDYVLSK